MSRGPQTFKQSDLTRAIKAAKKAGAGKVWIAKDGCINISVLADAEPEIEPGDHAEGTKEIIL
jgi:hypothetical protein